MCESDTLSTFFRGRKLGFNPAEYMENLLAESRYLLNYCYAEKKVFLLLADRIRESAAGNMENICTGCAKSACSGTVLPYEEFLNLHLAELKQASNAEFYISVQIAAINADIRETENEICQIEGFLDSLKERALF